MPANKRKPARKKAAAPRGPARSRAPKSTPAPKAGPLLEEFQQAISLAQNGFLFDAVQRFADVAHKDKRNELADDALFNVGICFLNMRLYHDAVAYFTKVIQGYPDATIAAVGGTPEFGRTAAKAHYGRLRAHLALGDRPAAEKDLAALKGYGDSYVVDMSGRKRTFLELGREALAAR